MDSTAKNPSCLLYGPLDARFEDRPIPVLWNPHDVIVRIAYTGVCGSDVSNPGIEITSSLSGATLSYPSQSRPY